MSWHRRLETSTRWMSDMFCTRAIPSAVLTLTLKTIPLEKSGTSLIRRFIPSTVIPRDLEVGGASILGSKVRLDAVFERVESKSIAKNDSSFVLATSYFISRLRNASQLYLVLLSGSSQPLTVILLS